MNERKEIVKSPVTEKAKERERSVVRRMWKGYEAGWSQDCERVRMDASQGKELHEASSNSTSCPWEISFAI